MICLRICSKSWPMSAKSPLLVDVCRSNDHCLNFLICSTTLHIFAMSMFYKCKAAATCNNRLQFFKGKNGKTLAENILHFLMSTLPFCQVRCLKWWSLKWVLLKSFIISGIFSCLGQGVSLIWLVFRIRGHLITKCPHNIGLLSTDLMWSLLNTGCLHKCTKFEGPIILVKIKTEFVVRYPLLIPIDLSHVHYILHISWIKVSFSLIITYPLLFTSHKESDVQHIFG